MIESVIVTIRNRFNDIDIDMELPTNVPIDELKLKILSILNEKYYQATKSNTFKTIRFKDKVLFENKTLGELEIWDGSILELE